MRSGLIEGGCGRDGQVAESSREVVFAQLPTEGQYFEGTMTNSKLTYGFYCRENNVFYECNSIEEYLEFQVYTTLIQKLLTADPQEPALNTHQPDQFDLD